MKVQIQYNRDQGISWSIETERDLWDLKRFIKGLTWGIDTLKIEDKEYNELYSDKQVYTILGKNYSKYRKQL